MRTKARLLSARILLVAGLAAGCAPTAGPAQTQGQARPVISLHRSPDCTCCGKHLQHLRDAGYQVVDRLEDDMTAFKAERGVPAALQSCHTSVIADYVVEGHVPASAIDQLIAERPDIDGIALPGMPSGAPGMPGTATAPLKVMAFDDATIFPPASASPAMTAERPGRGGTKVHAADGHAAVLLTGRLPDSWEEVPPLSGATVA